MKKLLIILVVAITLTCCSKSPEQQAQKNISDSIKKQMDDPNSYESVSFGKIEKYMTEPKDYPKFVELDKQYKEADSLERQAADMVLEMNHANTMEAALNIQKQRAAFANQLSGELDAFYKTFKSEKLQSMKHTYRAKNKMGAVVLDSCKVVLDDKLNVKFIKPLSKK